MSHAVRLIITSMRGRESIGINEVVARSQGFIGTLTFDEEMKMLSVDSDGVSEMG